MEINVEDNYGTFSSFFSPTTLICE